MLNIFLLSFVFSPCTFLTKPSSLVFVRGGERETGGVNPSPVSQCEFWERCPCHIEDSLWLRWAALGLWEWELLTPGDVKFPQTGPGLLGISAALRAINSLVGLGYDRIVNSFVDSQSFIWGQWLQYDFRKCSFLGNCCF